MSKMMFRGKVPVMSSDRCGTDSVFKEANAQTVISKATQLPCHPVRQTCIAVLHRSTRQWLIKVDGLEIKIQNQKLRIRLNYIISMCNQLQWHLLGFNCIRFVWSYNLVCVTLWILHVLPWLWQNLWIALNSNIGCLETGNVVAQLDGNTGILRVWCRSHPHHVGRERLEAAGLWFADKRRLQDPSFEHMKKQAGVHVAVLTADHTWSTRGRVTQLLYPCGTLMARWEQ